MNIYFESTLEKIAKMLTRRYGINVYFEGQKAYTDGKNIYIPYFSNISPELQIKLHGFLDHEVSHILFTDFVLWQTIKTKFELDLSNALEDIRIELKMREMHPGTDYYLSPLRDSVNQKHAELISTFSYLEKLVFASQLYVQGISFDAKDKEFDVVFSKITPYLDKFSKATTTKSILELTREIIKELELINEDEKKEEKTKKEESSSSDEEKSTESSGKDEKEESDSREEGHEDSESPSSSEEKEITEKKEEKTKKVTKKTVDKIKEELKEKKKGEPKFDVEKTFNEEISKIVEMPPEKALIVKDKLGSIDKNQVSVPVTTKFDEEHDYTGLGDKHAYQESRKKVQKIILPLKMKLEKLLKIKEDAKWKMDRERGRINASSLAKMQSDKSYRTIFKEFHKHETTNVSVQILIDQSGSMSGSKINMAKQTAIALAECLKDLNIDFEVTGFYSASSSSVASMYDSISEKSSIVYNRTSEKLVLNIFKKFDSSDLSGIEKLHVGEQNPDGECVKWAAQRLMTRKNTRKILFVLSDGQPACDCESQSILHNDLRLKVHQIEKSGIEVVGIGILTNAVQKYYKNNIVVSRLEELPTQCMQQLSAILLKNNR